jgi:hypothetical protein
MFTTSMKFQINFSTQFSQTYGDSKVNVVNTRERKGRLHILLTYIKQFNFNFNFNVKCD